MKCVDSDMRGDPGSSGPFTIDRVHTEPGKLGKSEGKP